MMNQLDGGEFYLRSPDEYEVRAQEDPEAVRRLIWALLTVVPEAGPPHKCDPESLYRGEA